LSSTAAKATAKPTAKPTTNKDGLVLKVDSLKKAFGPTQALSDCSIEVKVGEIHAVVGENGSGKSTLVKVLSGVHSPDAGSIHLDGLSISRIPTPRDAMDAGVATVFQEVLTIDARSVAENIWLGLDDLFTRRISDDVKRDRAQKTLASLMASPPHLETPIDALSLSERQTCCIARALMHDPKMLILDESTSALDVETRDRLFKMLRELAKNGTSIVFISHRMDEISEIADRVTVMRSGETVATLTRAQAKPEELVRLMTGADHLVAKEALEREARKGGEVLLKIDGMPLRGGGAPVALEVRAGEIVGLAGLEGHGQDDFIKALAFMGLPDVAYVPRERRAESIFESKSIRENFGMPTLARDTRRGVLRPRETKRRLSSYIDQLSIKLGDSDDLITTLSGGNQQKVIVARWLATNPRVLLLNDPTRGVDIGAKRDLYALLSGLAEQGMGIVMLSTEVDEQVELMDRVLVFREHEMVREMPRKELSREALVAAFFGQRAGK
jgi:ABC-type sugar transport system ATPase subunit